MSETRMTPTDDLHLDCVVIAERWEWAKNWAAREGLRNAKALRFDSDPAHLHGLPQGLKVYVLGNPDRDLDPYWRQHLAEMDAEVVIVRG